MSDREIRVCFVSDDSSSLTGGARSQASLIRGLSQRGVIPYFVSHRQTVQVENAIRNGCTTAFIPAKLYVYRKGQHDLISLLYYPVKRVLNAWQRRKMVRFLRESKIELVHLNSLFSCMEWAVAAQACHIPYVWHFREYLSDDHGYDTRGKARLTRYLKGAACRMAISNDIKQFWENKLDAECTLVYNGLEPEIYQQPAEGKFAGSSVRCILVGRVSEQKGQLVAIKAVERLVRGGNSRVHLTIVGDRGISDYEKMIREYVRARELEPFIDILPFTDDVVSVMKQCNVGILASSREAFGRVTIEYKMAGLVAVGTDSGGTRELIHDGADGLLFKVKDDADLSDKLLWIMTHREEAERIAKRGCEQACSDFSIQATVQRVLSIYHSLVS